MTAESYLDGKRSDRGFTHMPAGRRLLRTRRWSVMTDHTPASNRRSITEYASEVLIPRGSCGFVWRYADRPGHYPCERPAGHEGPHENVGPFGRNVGPS